MDKNIDKAYTLLDVLQAFDCIKIPVIQRDYAQGRPGREEIREKLLDYMLEALAGDGKAELDFVYGYEKDNSPGVFVPVDGQQRLTTLWLLHWYLGLKSRKLPEILPLLKKFTYETRPSSKDFLERLCDEEMRLDPERELRTQIVDESAWFAESWLLDTSIFGFITMLDAIAAHPVIQSNDAAQLLKRLQEGAVVFYFLRLENFSLGEEIYTRLNARGKALSDFETFKSRFFKISQKFPSTHKDIARKIDGKWVDKLWPYQKESLIDAAFLNYMRFLTKMFYLETQGKDKESGSETKSKSKTDFLDAKTIEEIFGESEPSLKFLIHAFDCLPVLARLAEKMDFEWEKRPGLGTQLRKIIAPDRDLSERDKRETHVYEMYIYAALLFLEKYPEKSGQPPQGIDDFLRVIRNLLGNSPDRASEWPNIIRSIRSLLTQEGSVYDVGYCLLNQDISLTGFRVEQRTAEIFKARLEKSQPQAVPILREIDENPYIRGRITRLIQTVCNSTEDLEKIQPEEIDLDALRGLYAAYCAMETYNKAEEYDGVWGELLNTSMYDDAYEGCCISGAGCNDYNTWEVHPELMKFAREVQKIGGDPGKAALKREKKFIKHLLKKNKDDLCATIKPKEQLYLLYIYTVRIREKECSYLFRTGLNFAWLPDETGYTTPFAKTANRKSQIFQSYDKRFRGEIGIRDYRTPIALFANGHTGFNKALIDFANEEA